MARPAQPLSPEVPPLVVDGRTRAVLRSPALTDARGNPYDGRQVVLELVAEATPSAIAIHPTLRGTGVSVGEGAYTLALLPRDLWLRLAPFAHERIYQRTVSAEHPPHYQPLRVLWQAAEFPIESLTRGMP